jgi:hypothetical protein
MNAKLKALGLVLAAMWALGAVAAPGAQAQEKGKLTFSHIVEGKTTTDESATLTGTQVGVHVLSVNGHNFTCETVKFHAEAKDGTETITTIAPEYTGCHIILGGFTFSATVTVLAGCDYHLSDLTTEGEEIIGNMKLTCTGEPIKINVPAAKCSITIGGEQEFKESVYAANMSGTPDDITLNTSVSKINFETSGGLCGESGNTGTYTGLTTVKAEKTGGGEQTEVTISGAGAQPSGRLTFKHFNGKTDESATLTGTQIGVHVLTINGHEVTCETFKLHAKVEDGEKAITTMAPAYENCHIIIGFTFKANVTVPEGCDYNFSDFTTEGEGGEYTGDTGLICTGEPIKIGGEQEFPESVHASNMSGTLDSITLSTTVEGIEFTSSGGLCGASGSGGTLTGLTTITAEEPGGGEQTDVTMSHN